MVPGWALEPLGWDYAPDEARTTIDGDSHERLLAANPGKVARRFRCDEQTTVVDIKDEHSVTPAETLDGPSQPWSAGWLAGRFGEDVARAVVAGLGLAGAVE